MAKFEINIKEMRFVIEKEMTHAYYLYEAIGDNCPPHVAGWHHKAFFPDVSIIDIISSGVDEPMSWPLSDPEDKND